MKLILLVVKDRILCAGIRSVLARHHYDVIASNDVDTGAQLAADHLPDLIIADAAALTSGLGAVRRRPRTAHIPIIAVVSAPRGDLQERPRRADVDRLLPVPFDASELLLAARPFLSNAPGTRQV